MDTTAHGRFAPSPTGPLHFGSLVAALGSYLHCKQANGRWSLRIEDIDPPREQAGAVVAILRSLEAHGLEWDGDVLYQSRRLDAYHEALAQLQRQGLTYYCRCSRSQLRAHGQRVDTQASADDDSGLRYPGWCRTRGHGPNDASVRLLTHDHLIGFTDLRLGRIEQRLESELGDFVLQRRDGLFAYQLAVVVDDAYQGITQIVRGSDLLGSTVRQIYLQQCLAYQPTDYLHLPLVRNTAGIKLSKQTGARALDNKRAVANLCAALEFLGQQPPAELADTSIANLLDWARSNWSVSRIP